MDMLLRLAYKTSPNNPTSKILLNGRCFTSKATAIDAANTAGVKNLAVNWTYSKSGTLPQNTLLYSVIKNTAPIKTVKQKVPSVTHSFTLIPPLTSKYVLLITSPTITNQ